MVCNFQVTILIIYCDATLPCSTPLNSTAFAITLLVHTSTSQQVAAISNHILFFNYRYICTGGFEKFNTQMPNLAFDINQKGTRLGS